MKLSAILSTALLDTILKARTEALQIAAGHTLSGATDALGLTAGDYALAKKTARR